MFGRKIVKRCAKGHVMELAWRRCPRCTGRSARTETGRDITEQTIIAAPAEARADETRIVTPSITRAPVARPASAPAAASTRASADSRAAASTRGSAPAPALPPPPPPAPLAKLVITAGPLAGRTLDLDAGVYRIGKAPPEGADAKNLTFPGDRFMSKVHAVLTLGTAQLVLSDPGSTNGTLVNGERVSRVVLKDGDEVRMGESLFRVELRR